jgi:DNA-binding YbaB/EbfC family protein
MKNLSQMMKQAQQMQEKMQEMQERLAEHEVTGAAGGGMVQVTMNGKGEMRGVKIDPSLVDPNDVEVLEDLVLAAANDAKAKVERYTQEQMQDLTGGMQLPPGFKLPGM